MKYLVGILVAIVVFFLMAITIDLANSNGQTGQAIFMAVVSLFIGLLSACCHAFSCRMESAEDAFDKLLRSFILQVRFVYVDSSRVGSHAESLLREQTNYLLAVVDGPGKQDLREKLLRMIDLEIGRSARKTPGHEAKHRFLTETEQRVKQLTNYASSSLPNLNLA